MIHTEYECNLCGDKYKRPEAYDMLKSYYCISQNFPTGSKFELRDLDAHADRHICKNCIETIKAKHNE